MRAPIEVEELEFVDAKVAFKHEWQVLLVDRYVELSPIRHTHANSVKANRATIGAAIAIDTKRIRDRLNQLILKIIDQDEA